jgi:hypothetical protein
MKKKFKEGNMEKEEIIILDEGLKNSPSYPACWCCACGFVWLTSWDW